MKLGMSSSALQDSILTRPWFNERKSKKRSTEGTSKAKSKSGSETPI